MFDNYCAMETVLIDPIQTQASTSTSLYLFCRDVLLFLDTKRNRSRQSEASHPGRKNRGLNEDEDGLKKKNKKTVAYS